MNNDIQLIASAIEGLQSNVIKDYIYPVGSVLISGALGMGVAYYTVNRQEYTKIELDKIRAINKTLLSALELRLCLVGIKSMYFKKLSGHPIDRMLHVPRVLLREVKSDFDLPSLSFLVPRENEAFNKWRSLDHIATVISNFNTVIMLWDKRNNLIENILPQLSEHYGKPLDLGELQNLIGIGNMAVLSDITESCLHMTDDLLIEITCLLAGLPVATDGRIDKKILSKFGGIIPVSLPTYDKYPLAVDLLTKVPEVNYGLLSMIQNISVDELKERYKPIYN